MNNKNEQKTVPSAIYQVREFQAMSTVFLTCVEETNYRTNKKTTNNCIKHTTEMRIRARSRLSRIVKGPIVSLVLHIRSRYVHVCLALRERGLVCPFERQNVKATVSQLFSY